MARARRLVLCVGAGIGWGMLAYGLGAKTFRDAAWAAVLVSPFIGLAVGLLTQPLFATSKRGMRWVVSLLTLYGSGALFAAAIGSYEFFVVDRHGSRFVDAQVAIAWGISVYIILLWPLAYGTHRAVEFFEQRPRY